jgi:hypothetical protein
MTVVFAGCFYVFVAVPRSLFVGGVIAARSTASEHARKKPAATDNGKLGAATRQVRGGAPCMPSEIVGTVLDGSA